MSDSRSSVGRKSLTRTLVSAKLSSWRSVLMLAILAGIGLWLVARVEGAVKEKLRDELVTILDADVAALRIWMESQEEAADAISSARLLPGWVGALDKLARDGAPVEAWRAAPEQAELRTLLLPLCEKLGFLGYVITDRSGRWIADGIESFVGGQTPPEAMRYVHAALEGEVVVSHPLFHDDVPDAAGVPGRRPIMFVASPIRGEDDRPFAVLALLIRPQEEFTQILQVARSGDSGETYAFNADGVMLSDSRFTADLRACGLLAPDAESAILRVTVRDPGGNLLEGHEPARARRALPLTSMAASAVAGTSGVDVDGYRDYRGVPVMGAWTWLPEYGFGVATEVDVDEALRAVDILRVSVWILLGLALVAGAGAAVTLEAVTRLRAKVQRAEQEVRRLGRYTLEEKIGEGGMGEVYKARHAMLRRPTALKVLRPQVATEEAIRRFEHEVQLTSRLMHPNTVRIYDYGRTGDGTFYYVMEYLGGLALDDLVRLEGPLPEQRVVHILRQVCESLEEAHEAGLVHRDVKPANVMLCRLGTQFDAVKVLDFGLVKDTGQNVDLELTDAHSIPGTPLYIAPEAIARNEPVGPLSDVYCLGAVGYFLLTGRPPFEGDKPLDVLLQHVNEEPKPPSERVPHSIGSRLETLILSCLAKDPSNRPTGARALAQELDACRGAREWDREQARAWWTERSSRATSRAASAARA